MTSPSVEGSRLQRFRESIGPLFIRGHKYQADAAVVGANFCGSTWCVVLISSDTFGAGSATIVMQADKILCRTHVQ